MTFADSGVTPSEGLRTKDFLLRPIQTTDAELDYEAVMESKEFLRTWEQSTWPEDDFTVEANRKDMEKLVARHESTEAFAYTVMNLDETECFGCVYISPPDIRWFQKAVVTPVGDHRWSDVEAMVSFWIRLSKLEEGMDRAVLDALRDWIATDWAFDRYVVTTNEQFVQQVNMLSDADLEIHFEMQMPESAGKDLAFAPA